ncbi:Hypothetical predicted protein [Octopus vulgaris]|nr:Hypothetical predicted protein [Octopus vulgaris]
MKEWMVFRNAISKSCRNIDDNLENCIYNLQLKLLESKKWRHAAAKRKKRANPRQFIANMTEFGSVLFNQSMLELPVPSFQCMSSWHSNSFVNNSSIDSISSEIIPRNTFTRTIIPAVFKRKKRKRRASNSSSDFDRRKIAELEKKMDVLVKMQTHSNELINSFAARLDIYERSMFAMKSNIEVLHKLLQYTTENLVRQESSIRKLHVRKSSTRNEMKAVRESVKLSRAYLQNSLHMQKNSSQTLKSSLKTLSNSEKRILDLFAKLQNHQSEPKPQISTSLHFDTIYPFLLLLIPLEVVLVMVCMRSCCRSSQNETPRTYITNPFRLFQGRAERQNQNSSENILEMIRQSDLDDVVCSLYFDQRYQLHESLTESLKQNVPNLRVEYCYVEQPSDILSIPRAKTYLLFVDLKQKNGIDPIKGMNNLKIFLLNGVQRMGADVFLVMTGDKNSDQLEGSTTLYHQSLKFLRSHRDVLCLISAKRVLSVNETWTSHQLEHVSQTIGVWHDIE